MPLSLYETAFGPEELKMMRRVFDRIVRARPTLLDELEQHDLAAHLIYHYRDGHRDEEHLLAKVRETWT